MLLENLEDFGEDNHHAVLVLVLTKPFLLLWDAHLHSHHAISHDGATHMPTVTPHPGTHSGPSLQDHIRTQLWLELWASIIS